MTATMSQAIAAEMVAAKKAPRQPAKLAIRSPVANESAPEIPMLAACPRYRSRHHFGINAVGQQLQACHIWYQPNPFR